MIYNAACIFAQASGKAQTDGDADAMQPVTASSRLATPRGPST